MKIQFKKLVEHAAAPTKANIGDAAYDLVAVDVAYNPEYNFYEYGTGISVAIPDGYVGLLFPRSSLSKKPLILCNHVGVIDSSYRGEICFRFKTSIPVKDLNEDSVYHPGDRIGQLMVIKRNDIEWELVEELELTERNTKGFGSSGN